MKTVVLQNVGRAGSAGTPLALKSFNAPAFDGIEVIAKREPPAASERTTLGPLLQVSEAAALGDDSRLPAAKNEGSGVRKSSLHETLEQAHQAHRRLGAGAGPGYRHWGINE